MRSAGRVETTPERLELFAQSLGADDRVALEMSGGAWEIARILEPPVQRVIVVSPDDTGIRQAVRAPLLLPHCGSDGARARVDREFARADMVPMHRAPRVRPTGFRWSSASDDLRGAFRDAHIRWKSGSGVP